MDPFTGLYWAMMVLGGAYLVIAAFGGHFHIGHDAGSGHGGVDLVHAHADLGPDADIDAAVGASADADHGSHDGGLGLLSPIIIATFLAMGGLTGLLIQEAGLVGALSLLPALAAGLALAVVMMCGLNWLQRNIEGSSHFRMADTANLEAEVITAIPAGGTGEVAFVIRGARRTGPARSADGDAIPRRTRVVIVRAEGTCYFVRPTVEERLRLLGEASDKAQPSVAETRETVAQSDETADPTSGPSMGKGTDGDA